MWFYDFRGKCIEVMRSDYNTDCEYYSKILAVKFNIKLNTTSLSVDDIFDLI
jgi:hypothetical protein